MFKSPVRTHRSNGGVKAKHALQICFLLLICFWLIYQVKHSRDKKKAFDETDDKQTIRTVLLPSDDILKLGRKDVNPKSVQPDLINGNSNEDEEEEDEETGIKVVKEDDKQTIRTVPIPSDDILKLGRKDVNPKSVQPDLINEKLNEEDEETGIEVVKEEEEIEVKDSESLKKKNSIHESRDQNYKADDASSAVTQTSRFIGSEKGLEISKNTTFKEFSDIKSNIEEADEALNSENRDEKSERDAIDSDSSTRLIKKDDGTDMEMLANVLNEDSNEEEEDAAAV